MEKPQYIDWIVEETGIVIKDDIPLKCYKIDYKDDESILDNWALHIRRNYIEDYICNLQPFFRYSPAKCRRVLNADN